MITGPEGVQVLVVDDDPVTLKVVSALLQKCCYKKGESIERLHGQSNRISFALSSLPLAVVTSTNGKDALQILKEDSSFDLVLSDVVMPGPLSRLLYFDRSGLSFAIHELNLTH